MQADILAPKFDESFRLPVPRFKLRWRMHFFNKPSKQGIFNGGGKQSEGAWAVDKNGLSKVIIEGEDIYTQELKTFLEIDGHNYATMEWLSYARLPGFFKYNGDIKTRPYIAGLTLFSREHKATVFVDGTYKVEELTPEEKLFRKKEHSI